MKKLFFLIGFIIISGLSLLIFILSSEEKLQGCGVKDSVFVCGNSLPSLSETAMLGKNIFNANCAACHKLDKNMTGPALRDIAKKYDTITLLKYIQGNKNLIESKDYYSPCVNFPQITEEDLNNLLLYTN